MMKKICPVCGLEQDQSQRDCAWCSWDFSPMLGTPEQVAALLRDRLDRARSDWHQRLDHPEQVAMLMPERLNETRNDWPQRQGSREDVPDLERDPFETMEEFAVRTGLAERPWFIGEVELLKARYDLPTGLFPLRIRSLQAWATKRWVRDADALY
ncbi:MAG: hypothetical protein EOM91_21435, partial [Sphingobacteriia bacterium]|nr:hypothetical protein [Sphingobacteriia bacterium]